VKRVRVGMRERSPKANAVSVAAFAATITAGFPFLPGRGQSDDSKLGWQAVSGPPEIVDVARLRHPCCDCDSRALRGPV
jgi:hypothetical protein